jgi:hypothetical protein
VRSRAILRGNGILLLLPLAAGCGGMSLPGDEGAAKASIDASSPLDAATFDGTSGAALDAQPAPDAASSVDTKGCRPKTCSELGYTCGINADGCGGTISCGTCTAPAFCGARASASAAASRSGTAPAPRAFRSRAKRRASAAASTATDAAVSSTAVRARLRTSAEAVDSARVGTRRRWTVAWAHAPHKRARSRTSNADSPGTAATFSLTAGRARRRSLAAAEGRRTSAAAAARALPRRARSSATSADSRATGVAVRSIAVDAAQARSASAGGAMGPRSGRTADRLAFRRGVRSRWSAAQRGTAAAALFSAAQSRDPRARALASLRTHARPSPASRWASGAVPPAMDAVALSIAGRACHPRFAEEGGRASADSGARGYGQPCTPHRRLSIGGPARGIVLS